MNNQNDGLRIDALIDRQEANVQQPYQALSLNDSQVAWRKQIDELIREFRKAYISDESVESSRMVQMLEKIEANSVYVLYKKMMYAEHIIDSYMNQINCSGPNIQEYDSLMNLSLKAISIQQEFMRNVRNAPNVFKSMHIEMINLGLEQDRDAVSQTEFPPEYVEQPTRDQVSMLDQLTEFAKAVETRNASIDVTKAKEFPEEYTALGEEPKYNDFEKQAAIEKEREHRLTKSKLSKAQQIKNLK